MFYNIYQSIQRSHNNLYLFRLCTYDVSIPAIEVSRTYIHITLPHLYEILRYPYHNGGYIGFVRGQLTGGCVDFVWRTVDSDEYISRTSECGSSRKSNLLFADLIVTYVTNPFCATRHVHERHSVTRQTLPARRHTGFSRYIIILLQ